MALWAKKLEYSMYPYSKLSGDHAWRISRMQTQIGTIWQLAGITVMPDLLQGA